MLFSDASDGVCAFGGGEVMQMWLIQSRSRHRRNHIPYLPFSILSYRPLRLWDKANLAELNSYKAGAKASAEEDKDDDEDEAGGDGEDKLSKGEVMDLFKMLMKAKVRRISNKVMFCHSRKGFISSPPQ